MQFLKKQGRKETCTIVEFGPSKIDGHGMVTVLLFSQCTRYAQHYSSFLNLQDVCNIIQVNYQYFEHPLKMKIYLSYRG